MLVMKIWGKILWKNSTTTATSETIPLAGKLTYSNFLIIIGS
jgi:hypothetical protein